MAKEALWEKQREVEREIPCHVTKVPGVCKKGYWKATNEPTVPDPNLAVHSQRHLVTTRYLWRPGARASWNHPYSWS